MARPGQDNRLESSDQVEALLAQARRLEDQGNFSEAIGRYKAAMALVPENDPLYEHLESVVGFLEQGPPGGAEQTGPQPERGPGVPVWLWVVVGLGTLLAAIVIGLGVSLFISPGSVPIPNLSGLGPTSQQVAPAPTVMPAPSQAAPLTLSRPTSNRVVFQDSFAGSTLDPAQWGEDNLAGALFQVRDGIVQLASSANHFPYIHTRTDPFPSTGNFRFEVQYRFPRVATCGVPVVISSFLLPPGLSHQETNNLSQAAEQAGGLSIWFWHSVLYYRQGLTHEDIGVPGNPTGWHVVTVEYVGQVYHISVDGTPLYTSPPTSARPKAIWMGIPFELSGSGCAWDTLQVDSVSVETLP